jgi:hypothetical protein
MDTGNALKREQLRFLRDTARKLREIGIPTSQNDMRPELLRLANQIDQEADDLEMIARRDQHQRVSAA